MTGALNANLMSLTMCENRYYPYLTEGAQKPRRRNDSFSDHRANKCWDGNDLRNSSQTGDDSKGHKPKTVFLRLLLEDITCTFNTWI